MNTKVNSLYRKHRPKKFSDVIGQEHVTKTLTNQILKKNIAHAYLFCGTRGCGKTTVAKIFAHAVNDLEYNNANNNMDIFEIDAASNNGVDSVRELIEKVKYPPVNSKYKVYIIDEVHMFSTSAFNALLKTLEEPPSYVIFILATTEPHKLPPTVLSRCLRFDFRSASVSQISELLKKTFNKENIKYTEDAVLLLAIAGQGSFRDALSLSETVASFSDNNITEQSVNQVIGSVDKNLLEKLLTSIKEKNLKSIKVIVDEVFSVGRNINSVIKDFLTVVKTHYMRSQDTKTMSIYQKFAELELSIKTATDAQHAFEGCCLLATII